MYVKNVLYFVQTQNVKFWFCSTVYFPHQIFFYAFYVDYSDANTVQCWDHMNTVSICFSQFLPTANLFSLCFTLIDLCSSTPESTALAIPLHHHLQDHLLLPTKKPNSLVSHILIFTTHTELSVPGRHNLRNVSPSVPIAIVTKSTPITAQTTPQKGCIVRYALIRTDVESMNISCHISQAELLSWERMGSVTGDEIGSVINEV